MDETTRHVWAIEERTGGGRPVPQWTRANTSDGHREVLTWLRANYPARKAVARPAARESGHTDGAP